MKINNPSLLNFPIIVNNRKEFNKFKKKCKVLGYNYPECHISKNEFPITISEHRWDLGESDHYIKFILGK